MTVLCDKTQIYSSLLTQAFTTIVLTLDGETQKKELLTFDIKGKDAHAGMIIDGSKNVSAHHCTPTLLEYVKESREMKSGCVTQ